MLGARTIRVFVSSTWTDLQAERAAVQEVLHRMNEVKSIGMEYFGSSPEGTLGASVTAVDRCDVYIGIIGGRYGSGITEQEYRRARERNLPCLMYVLPCAPECSHTDSEQLQAFKATIRGNHLVAEVNDARELASRVSVDLHNWLADTRVAPGALLSGMETLPADYKIRFDNFLAAYLGTSDRPVPFGGREAVLRALDSWLNDTSATPYLVVAGPAGRGKSSLLCRWTRRLVNRDDLDVVFVPISVRFRTNQPSVILSALCTRIAALRNQSFQTNGEPTPDQWRAMAASFLLSTPPGRTVVVVLDGLDEAAGWEPGPDLFPLNPPSGLRVVVSARYRAEDEDGRGWLSALGWDDARIGACLDLLPLDLHGIADVLQRQEGVPRTVARDVAAVSELLRITQGDPLLVRMFVDDLRTRAETDLPSVIQGFRSLPPGLKGFFKLWWQDQRALWGAAAPLQERAVQVLLSMLSVALGPLGRDDLMRLAPAEAGLNTWTVEDALRPLSRLVVRTGSRQDLVFAHPRLAMFFYGEMSASERMSWEVRFIEWGKTTVERLEAGKLEPEAVPAYLLQYYSAHLDRSPSERSLLFSLLSNGWREAWEKFEGGYTGYLADIERVWHFADLSDWNAVSAGLPPSNAGRAIRCALYRGSIGDLAQNLSGDLLAALVRARIWTGEQAIAAALQNPEPNQAVSALLAIAPALDVQDRPRAMDAAIAATARDTHDRSERLAVIVEKSIELDLPEQACTAARGTKEPDHHLSAIASHVSKSDPLRAIDIAREMNEPQWAVWQLAPSLPDWSDDTRVVPLLISLGEEFGFRNLWGEAVLQVAQRLPDDIIPELLRSLQPVWHAQGWSRATIAVDLYERLMAVIGPRMSAEDQHRELERLSADRSFNRRLLWLTPYLHLDVIDRVVKIASALASRFVRMEVQAVIAGRLAGLGRVEEALRYYRNRDRHIWGSDEYRSLAETLPLPIVSGLIEAGLAEGDDSAVGGILLGCASVGRADAVLDFVGKLHSGRLSVLQHLIPHLSTGKLQRAVKLAESEEEHNADLAVALAIRFFNAGDKAAALQQISRIGVKYNYPAEIGEAVRMLTDPGEIALAARVVVSDATVLASVAPYVAASLWPELLGFIAEISDDRRREGCLKAAFPYLPATEHDAVLEAAFNRGAIQLIEEFAPHVSASSARGLLQQLTGEDFYTNRLKAALTARLIALGDPIETAFVSEAGGSVRALSGIERALLPDRLPVFLDYAVAHKVSALDWSHLVRKAMGAATFDAVVRRCTQSREGREALAEVADKLSEVDCVALLRDAALMGEDAGAEVGVAIAGSLSRDTLQTALRLERRRQSGEQAKGSISPARVSKFVARLAELGDYDAAIELAREIQSLYERSAALGRIAGHLRPELLPSVLDLCREIRDVRARDGALVAVGKTLTANRRASAALAAAQSIHAPDTRAEALAVLTQELEEPDKGAAARACVTSAWQSRRSNPKVAADLGAAACFVEACEAALAMSYGPDRAEALRSIASAAARAQRYSTAIRAVSAISEKCSRFKATAQLLGEIPEADRFEAVAAAEAALEAFEYARLSLGNLESLTADSSPAEIEQALAAAEGIRNLPARLQAMAILGGVQPEPRRTTALLTIAQAAAAVRDPEIRAKVLISVGTRLSPAVRADVVARALTAAREVAAAEDRVMLIAGLIGFAPPAEVPEMSTFLLKNVEAVSYWDRRSLSIAFARFAPATSLPQLLATADPAYAGDIASALATRGLADQAVEWALSLPDIFSQVEGFAAAAGLNHVHLVSEVLERVAHIPADLVGRSRSDALNYLSRFMSPDERKRAVGLVQEIDNDYVRSLGLVALLPGLFGAHELAIIQAVAEHDPIETYGLERVLDGLPSELAAYAQEFAAAAASLDGGQAELLATLLRHVSDDTRVWIDQELRRSRMRLERPPLESVVGGLVNGAESCTAAYAVMARHVAEPRASELLAIVSERLEKTPAQELAELAGYLDPPENLAVAERACAVARDAKDVWSTITALVRSGFVGLALREAARVSKMYPATSLVESLTEVLDENDGESALFLHNHFELAWDKLVYLIRLWPFLPEPLHNEWGAAAAAALAESNSRDLLSGLDLTFKTEASVLRQLVRAGLADQVIEKIASHGDVGDRARMIRELAPELAERLTPLAYQLIPAIPDDYAWYKQLDVAVALTAIATYTDSNRRKLLEQGIQLWRTLDASSRRRSSAPLLAAIAELPYIDSYPTLRDDLHTAAAESRENVLAVIEDYAPVLERCGPDVLPECVRAVSDVGQRWP